MLTNAWFWAQWYAFSQYLIAFGFTEEPTYVTTVWRFSLAFLLFIHRTPTVAFQPTLTLWATLPKPKARCEHHVVGNWGPAWKVSLELLGSLCSSSLTPFCIWTLILEGGDREEMTITRTSSARFLCKRAKTNKMLGEKFQVNVPRTAYMFCVVWMSTFISTVISPMWFHHHMSYRQKWIL